jgi:hypothetical protein
VTPDELKTIPQSWLTDQNTPYPKVPIFGNEAELNKGVAEVAKDYGLTAAQKQQFIAKQLWLIQQRDRDVQSVAFGTHVSGKAGEPLQYPTQPAPHENFNRVVGQTVEGKPVPSGTPSAAQGFDIEDGKLPKRGD